MLFSPTKLETYELARTPGEGIGEQDLQCQWQLLLTKVLCYPEGVATQSCTNCVSQPPGSMQLAVRAKDCSNIHRLVLKLFDFPLDDISPLQALHTMLYMLTNIQLVHCRCYTRQSWHSGACNRNRLRNRIGFRNWGRVLRFMTGFLPLGGFVHQALQGKWHGALWPLPNDLQYLCQLSLGLLHTLAFRPKLVALFDELPLQASNGCCCCSHLCCATPAVLRHTIQEGRLSN
mmetsp:Transcript_35933/g.82511  ORF Transcript_35933/g.82511 Transcript_35933/m.82511 type:complete len:232 (+) Transcript_35933:101-796(+)